METTLQFKDKLAELMGDMPAITLASKIREQGIICTEAAVSRWLSGDRMPRSETISYIARALDCTPNDLLGFSDT